MFIPRTLGAEIAAAITTGKKIIIVYGARRTGKTTLLKEIIGHLPEKKIFINADEKKYVDILSARDLNKLRLLLEGYDLLFIDEAQRVPDIGINLKLMYDHFPDLKIITSGSSSFELANRVREPLTGRTKTYQLYPISVNELRRDNNPFELAERVEELLLFGMYPEIFTLKNRKEKKAYLRELSTDYLYKDVLAIASIKHAHRLDSLLRLLALQTGSQVSMSELARQLQMSKETVAAYIDLMEKAFILFRLSGFSRNLRKEVAKMDKIFFWDLGVRNAILNNFNELELRTDVGAMWENFIISERLKFLSNHLTPKRTYFWRTYTGAELDFVEEEGDKLCGYEIKWGKRRKKIPAAWINAYPNAGVEYINRDNFMDFISEPHE